MFEEDTGLKSANGVKDRPQKQTSTHLGLNSGDIITSQSSRVTESSEFVSAQWCASALRQVKEHQDIYLGSHNTIKYTSPLSYLPGPYNIWFDNTFCFEEGCKKLGNPIVKIS